MDFVVYAALGTVAAAAWLAIGVGLVFYPEAIGRYYVEYYRERVRGPARVIMRPAARFMETSLYVLLLRLTGLGWMVMGVVLIYLLVRLA